MFPILFGEDDDDDADDWQLAVRKSMLESRTPAKFELSSGPGQSSRILPRARYATNTDYLYAAEAV